LTEDHFQIHWLFYRTPLHWAAAMGHHQCVSVLLNMGITPNPSDIEGGTPLDYAKQTGHRGIWSYHCSHPTNYNQQASRPKKSKRERPPLPFPPKKTHSKLLQTKHLAISKIFKNLVIF
jgi:ankyrin repeat protein